ncbi:hypothetical protein OROHE_027033 [Orobanche hederae]
MKIKRFLSIPVLSVLLLFGFIYYATIFVFIEDWYGFRSSAGLLNSLIFSGLGSLCAFSLFVCVLSDPGGVPSGYIPDVEDNRSPDQEVKRNGMHVKHCDKCTVNKPPRAHHCRVCRRCDHHCSWINNCVGHRNYKTFLLSVFYATAASTYSAIVIMCCTLNKNWDVTGKHLLKAFYVVCGMMTV